MVDRDVAGVSPFGRSYFLTQAALTRHVADVLTRETGRCGIISIVCINEITGRTARVLGIKMIFRNIFSASNGQILFHFLTNLHHRFVSASFWLNVFTVRTIFTGLNDTHITYVPEQRSAASTLDPLPELSPQLVLLPPLALSPQVFDV